MHTDLIREIHSHLRYPDLLRFQQTSKSLRATVTNLDLTRSLWLWSLEHDLTAITWSLEHEYRNRSITIDRSEKPHVNWSEYIENTLVNDTKQSVLMTVCPHADAIVLDADDYKSYDISAYLSESSESTGYALFRILVPDATCIQHIITHDRTTNKPILNIRVL